MNVGGAGLCDQLAQVQSSLVKKQGVKAAIILPSQMAQKQSLYVMRHGES